MFDFYDTTKDYKVIRISCTIADLTVDFVKRTSKHGAFHQNGILRALILYVY